MLSRLFAYSQAALALETPLPLRWFEYIALLALHALGLSALARVMAWPPLLALIPPALLGAALLVPRFPRPVSPALLTPCFFVYALIVIRYLFIRGLHGEVPGYFEYALPDPRVLLRLEPALIAAIIYALGLATAQVLQSRARAIRLGAVVLSGLVLGWALVEFIAHRTYGATGSDPFAYVQMGIDLATHGTPTHRFPLFSVIVAHDLAWYPLLHVGYRLPYNALGDAITVWPPGGALAYALAFRLGGEAALYFVNPLFSLAGAVAAGLLAWELARGDSATLRAACAAIAFALLATAYEMVNWAGVTMVDAQALLFSTLAIYFARRASLRGSLGFSCAAGIAFGLAYAVRHTQLVLALSLGILFLCASQEIRLRVRNLMVAGLASLIVALPDLWYHHLYLGNWLMPESEELALFSFEAIPQTLVTLAAYTFVGAEFGWLTPFIVLGIVVFTRHSPILSAALFTWLGTSLLLHLPYPALRLRDLLPEFPVVTFYAAYGMVAPVAALVGLAVGCAERMRRAWAGYLAGALLFAALQLNVLRTWNTLPRAFSAPTPRFGAMTAAQRAAFDALAHLTPVNALIGASLNSGAIELYARRVAFRPADWCSLEDCPELREFLARVQHEKRPVYLLEDNASLARVLDDLREEYRLERVTTLDVPLFGQVAPQNPGALWKIGR